MERRGGGLTTAIAFEVNGSKFLIGDFINALLSFLLVALAVYFFVAVPVNALTARMRRGEAQPDPTSKTCPECLSRWARLFSGLCSGFGWLITIGGVTR